MTSVESNLASTKIQKMVHKEARSFGIKGVLVDVSPIGETTLQMSFLLKDGVFTDDEKTEMRNFIQNGIKSSIKVIVSRYLGWNGIRIRTCSRHRDQSRYTWFIEQR